MAMLIKLFISIAAVGVARSLDGVDMATSRSSVRF